MSGAPRPSVLRRRLAGVARDDSGFTVVELLVTMLVLSVVSASVLALLASLMKNDRYQEALVNNQEKVRFALLEVTRDIRNANPVQPLATAAEHASKIEVLLGPSNGLQTYVRWQLTGTTLTRSEITGPGGAAMSTRTVLVNVDNSTMGLTLFRYYDEHGVEIDATHAAGDFANCSIRVDVTIGAADDPVGSRFVENGSAEIRNLLPGGIGC